MKENMKTFYLKVYTLIIMSYIPVILCFCTFIYGFEEPAISNTVFATFLIVSPLACITAWSGYHKMRNKIREHALLDAAFYLGRLVGSGCTLWALALIVTMVISFHNY